MSFSLIIINASLTMVFSQANSSSHLPRLLTDPFLQITDQSSIKVIWFTEFLGTANRVLYGKNLEFSVPAKTTKLSKMREDNKSKTDENYDQLTPAIFGAMRRLLPD